MKRPELLLLKMYIESAVNIDKKAKLLHYRLVDFQLNE